MYVKQGLQELKTYFKKQTQNRIDLESALPEEVI